MQRKSGGDPHGVTRPRGERLLLAAQRAEQSSGNQDKKADVYEIRPEPVALFSLTGE